MRSLYIIGSFYLAATAFALVRGPPQRVVGVGPQTRVVQRTGSSEWQWYQAAKPYCNTVEVEMIHQRSPRPETLEGAGYSAACYALAGKIDQARDEILTVQADSQWRAAGIVFDIAHPIADMGDDESAGPIMELVVEFWPNHYQALYHAGASNYVLRRFAKAGEYLRDFIHYYDGVTSGDPYGFRSRAEEMLANLRQ